MMQPRLAEQVDRRRGGNSTSAGTRSLAPRKTATPTAGGCSCGGGCPRCATSHSRGAISGTTRTGTPVAFTVGAPGDRFERAADQIAGQSVDTPMPSALSTTTGARDDGRVSRGLRTELSRSEGGGRELSNEMQASFESLLDADLDGVRIHDDATAARMSRALRARAFTRGRDIYFADGEYDPGAEEGRRILAHELAHVVQQSGVRDTTSRGHAAPEGEAPGIQRVIELRPPGAGEASAFGRRQEIVDRLNTISTAIQYRLDGRALNYNIVDEAALTHFDRMMRGYIDQAAVVPLRLITGAGYVQSGGTFTPLQLDSFVEGYVDLEDLLASDDVGFQLRLTHFLTERFSTRNYERRIGTAFTGAEFTRVHNAAHAAEAGVLRDMAGDPTIRYRYSEARPNGTWVVGFWSDEGYWIFRVVRGAGRDVRGAIVWAQMPDGRHLTIAQLRAERAAAAAPPQAPAHAGPQGPPP